MTPKIKKSKPPAVLSKETKKLFGDAEGAGFTHLGWLTVTVFFPMTMACFAEPGGDIALAFIGSFGTREFEPMAVDMVSQFGRNRKLTTTTIAPVIPQTHRGIFKYSYPTAKITVLLRQHRKHIKEVGGRVTVRVRTLRDFENAVRAYIEYELPG
jgi:hypothetical protein